MFGASLGTVPSGFVIAQTGDYKGAGMSDIAWIDGAGNVSIWFMNGTVASSAGVGNVGTAWQFQSLNAE